MGVPITAFVPPFPAQLDEYSFQRWGTTVASFCKGAQTVELLEGTGFTIYATITGAMTYFEGSVNVGEEYLSNVDLLPVLPLNNGFCTVCASGSSDVISLGITAGSTVISTSGLASGEYMIKGNYFKGDE